MAILFEKEVVKYLGLPSIPIREWDKRQPFDKGVALLELNSGFDAYAVCSFHDGDTTPRIIKVFSIEPFKAIKNVFVVPNYMNNIEDVNDMDLDDESKQKAIDLLREANDLENDGISSDVTKMEDLPTWIFEEITNKEEAIAWLRRYNKRNKIKGVLPKNEETIKLRLYSIYMDINNKK